MTEDTIRLERRDTVRIAELNRGVTNPINGKLISELHGIVRELEEDPQPGALVLTSPNPKFFSIGFDIPELFGLARGEFASFYHSFNRLCLDLFTLPRPTIAALTGHATAGGCILAMCCDVRFIAAGRKLMGLNEIHLGVPIPYPTDRILLHLVGFRNARDITDTGEFFPPERLLEMGLVDRILPPDRVVAEATDWALEASRRPQRAFARIKANRTGEIREQILKSLQDREEEFVDCWYSEPARSRLEEAMKKF
jgi:enoyl-CoA hydratase/carnithine racemase